MERKEAKVIRVRDLLEEGSCKRFNSLKEGDRSLRKFERESYYMGGVKELSSFEKEKDIEGLVKWVKKEVELKEESVGKIGKFISEGLKELGMEARVVIKGRIGGSLRSKTVEEGGLRVGKRRGRENIEGSGSIFYGVEGIRTKHGVSSIKVWVRTK